MSSSLATALLLAYMKAACLTYGGRLALRRKRPRLIWLNGPAINGGISAPGGV